MQRLRIFRTWTSRNVIIKSSLRICNVTDIVIVIIVFEVLNGSILWRFDIIERVLLVTDESHNKGFECVDRLHFLFDTLSHLLL